MSEPVIFLEEDDTLSTIKALIFLALLLMLAIVLGHIYVCHKAPWWLKPLLGC